MRLHRHFLLIFSSLFLIIVGSFSWLLLSRYFESEMSFRRNLSFLNFEQSGYRLREALSKNYRTQSDPGAAEITFTTQPVAVVQMGASSPLVYGRLPASWPGIVSDQAELQIRSLGGALFLVRSMDILRSSIFEGVKLAPGRYQIIWPLRRAEIKAEQMVFAGRLWIINLESELLYSSQEKLGRDQLIKHPLVQKFIQSPLTRFQSFLHTEEKAGSYGFSMLIPETNMTLFAEVPLSAWTSPILRTIGISLGILLGGFVFLLLVLRSFILGLRQQAKHLADVLDRFATGYFIPPEVDMIDLYHELEPLRRAIKSSSKRLREKITELEREKPSA